LPADHTDKSLTYVVEGVVRTPALVLLRSARAPRAVTLDGQPLVGSRFSRRDGLVWIPFENEARPRTLMVQY
jgi:hypothetical protein